MEDRSKKGGQHAGSEQTGSEHKGTMSHKEAGHLGGAAHHTCRGSECHQKGTHAKSESKKEQE